MTLSRLLIAVVLLLTVAVLMMTAACSKNMAVSVKPPECTTDEKLDCSTITREPNAMAEEPFFQKENR